MQQNMKTIPDNTAVRVALWRALHLQVDAPPHILEDELGLQLAAPEANWQQRPDMHPEGTRQARLSIVTRARFVEDLVTAATDRGVRQYVILGAGLDTFALRRKDLSSKITVYEIDEPSTQAWKQQRLAALGYDIADRLRFVPVDFEKHAHWLQALANAGFDMNSPAVVACTGVSMYLTREAILGMLQQVAALAPNSTLALSFLLPKELLKPEEQRLLEMAMKGAAAAGTPFLSFFTPAQMLELATEAGLKNAAIISGSDLSNRYFTGRKDGLSASGAEPILVAAT
ncbi:MAG TPA: class I SAM-dependent methyltransferase [Chitinophaga sp.]|uniref:class I SAM-dependent methyltransferase n=1 Tax=Chitinophaga sp. TaxID=1869181 RepID=UPI002DB9FD21|nr:class I SAM-dependent methyltransferase [Chitinophaga sp.]HEU4552310.1 class I SAM-dependent methyltransferase [Chitinophaga sp.]